jgi:UPF0755 protein
VIHLSSRTFALAFVLLVAALVGSLVLAGTIAWTRITERYRGYDAAEQFIEIPPGAGAGDVRRRLVDAGIVRDDLTARAALAWTGHAERLKAGEYRFDRPLSAVDVFDRIASGEVYTRRLTFREGLTIAEMAAIYAGAGFGSAEDFIDAAGNAALIHDIDPEAPDLEGYLFPETYTVPRVIPAAQLVSHMVDRFRRSLPDLPGRAKATGLTVRQVVTLASIVEKETAHPAERPVVAGVYRNRMRIGMGMQADPTVIYALQKAGRYDGNIRREDLRFDSPYNTYRYPGLPPGPIAAPGQESVEAVLEPADVKYLYFVSRNDGTHVFAETHAQHNANVQEYQVLYFRRLREQERQSTGSR